MGKYKYKHPDRTNFNSPTGLIRSRRLDARSTGHLTGWPKVSTLVNIDKMLKCMVRSRLYKHFGLALVTQTEIKDLNNAYGPVI
jgi:hypothetical protein